METFIVKRDGTREAFSMEKIQRAIAKAFLSVGSFATQDVITNILSRVSVTDGISSRRSRTRWRSRSWPSVTTR